MRCQWVRYIDHKGNRDQCEDDAMPGEQYCSSHLRKSEIIYYGEWVGVKTDDGIGLAKVAEWERER